MRGKRSKQYRKLMEQFSMTFGFREPYQVLVDAEMVRDSCRFKMELAPALERTVHGKVKPMITQCEIRKLYEQKREPGVSEAIELAKTLERRRCGHHPDEYPKPLSTEECLESVVDPKSTGQNKHRYVVASQSQEVRRMLRAVRGVPLIYIKRSVMILEPMADESVQVRMREERGKFRAELKKRTTGKRKRDDGDEKSGDEDDDDEHGEGTQTGGKDGRQEEQLKKKKKNYGAKGPNPLSIKKSQKKMAGGEELQQQKTKPKVEESTDAPAKRKRRKKTKAAGATDVDNGGSQAVVVASTTGED